MPSDAADEGTAAIAVVVLGDMGSPPHRAVERPLAVRSLSVPPTKTPNAKHRFLADSRTQR